RDGHVTGVQTCALPIWEIPSLSLLRLHVMPSTRLCDSLSDYPPFAGGTAIDNWPTLLVVDHDPEMLRALVFFFEKRGFHVAAARSEERRVGKECGGRCG